MTNEHSEFVRHLLLGPRVPAPMTNAGSEFVRHLVRPLSSRYPMTNGRSEFARPLVRRVTSAAPVTNGPSWFVCLLRPAVRAVGLGDSHTSTLVNERAKVRWADGLGIRAIRGATNNESGERGVSIQRIHLPRQRRRRRSPEDIAACAMKADGTKRCATCGETGPARAMFHRHRGRGDGYQDSCRECHCATQRQHNADKGDSVKALLHQVLSRLSHIEAALWLCPADTGPPVAPRETIAPIAETKKPPAETIAPIAETPLDAFEQPSPHVEQKTTHAEVKPSVAPKKRRRPARKRAKELPKEPPKPARVNPSIERHLLSRDNPLAQRKGTVVGKPLLQRCSRCEVLRAPSMFGPSLLNPRVLARVCKKCAPIYR